MSTPRLNILCLTMLILLAGGVTSCRTPKDIAYFQDVRSSRSYSTPPSQITIKPFDKLSIVVNARDPQVTDALNLPYVARYIGTDNTNSQGLVAYNVDADGYVELPYLGAVRLAGLTRTEAARLIKDKLQASELANDPVVTIDFFNAQVAVLGEVKNPGRYDIVSDNMTILDMLGAAGDLTIYGQRTNVKLLRKSGGQESTYVLNLLSAEELMSSPAYYVQQDDVIYVEPNATRMRQSTANGNTMLSSSFWISVASVCITMAALLIK